MKTSFVVDKTVLLVLSPENSMEIELLKTLSTQSNEFISIRTAGNVLSHTIPGSLVICNKTGTEETSNRLIEIVNTENL